MSDCEERLEKACALATVLERYGFNVNVLVCKDGVPCLSAYKKPTVKLVKFREGKV